MAPKASTLSSRLDSFLVTHAAAGLKSRGARKRFLEVLGESQSKLRVLRRRRFHGSADPHAPDFHPLAGIVSHFDHGNPDEAVWLAFLSIQFGWDASSQTKDTIRQFYTQFDQALWDWNTAAEDAPSIRTWMQANRNSLRQLKFGNHRKFETNKPDSGIGTPAVIESFIDWAAAHGDGSAHAAFASLTTGKDRETDFDRLFRQLKVRRFGRTAKFDLLCLLGNLGVLRISPAHPYLRGSTGPRAGAVLLVTGKREGRLTDDIVDSIRQLQHALGVEAECMEDALCNWQKKKTGFLSRTC